MRNIAPNEQPCAMEYVDGNPEVLDLAMQCAYCALRNTVTIVKNADGITEFMRGTCRAIPISAMNTGEIRI